MLSLLARNLLAVSSNMQPLEGNADTDGKPRRHHAPLIPFCSPRVKTPAPPRPRSPSMKIPSHSTVPSLYRAPGPCGLPFTHSPSYRSPLLWVCTPYPHWIDSCCAKRAAALSKTKALWDSAAKARGGKHLPLSIVVPLSHGFEPSPSSVLPLPCFLLELPWLCFIPCIQWLS